MHNGGYSPLCKGLDEMPIEVNLLPKARRPLATVADCGNQNHVRDDIVFSQRMVEAP